jgi:Protein of unknown function (DUF3047)
VTHGAPLLARGLATPLRAREPAPDRDSFRRHASTLLASPIDGLRGSALIELPASTWPWSATGLELDPAQRVTIAACGRSELAPLLGIGLGAAHQLWTRVGGRGPISRGPRAARTLAAPHGGELELGLAFPGEWADTDGAVRGARLRRRLTPGGFTVLALGWERGAEVAAQLRVLAQRAGVGALGGLLREEADTLEHGESRTAPEQWEPHPVIGESAVYAAAGEQIGCATHGDAGIIRHPVHARLDASTRLRWRWQVDELPSLLPEDSLLTHDYLSIAVEFEDGRDLTYQWSSTLEPGLAYRCPLPFWRERETHVVIRSGSEQLGRWVEEERPVLADHAAAIGGQPPRSVVAVWLIANSTLQRRQGTCVYAGIELSSDREQIPLITNQPRARRLR